MASFPDSVRALFRVEAEQKDLEKTGRPCQRSRETISQNHLDGYYHYHRVLNYLTAIAHRSIVGSCSSCALLCFSSTSGIRYENVALPMAFWCFLAPCFCLLARTSFLLPDASQVSQFFLGSPMHWLLSSWSVTRAVITQAISVFSLGPCLSGLSLCRSIFWSFCILDFFVRLHNLLYWCLSFHPGCVHRQCLCLLVSKRCCRCLVILCWFAYSLSLCQLSDPFYIFFERCLQAYLGVMVVLHVTLVSCSCSHWLGLILAWCRSLERSLFVLLFQAFRSFRPPLWDRSLTEVEVFDPPKLVPEASLLRSI